VTSELYIFRADVRNHPRKLQKGARNLEQHGYIRLNYSVWFGWFDPKKNPVLMQKLKELLRNPLAKGSRFYFLPMRGKEFGMIRHHNGRKVKSLDYWTGDRATEFFQLMHNMAILQPENIAGNLQISRFCVYLCVAARA